MVSNNIQCEGLWEKLQKAQVKTIGSNPLSFEELKQLIVDVFSQPYKPNRICLPTYYLLAIPDDEFIYMFTHDMTEFNKNYYFMGGSEANRLVQERKAKLLPNEK